MPNLAETQAAFAQALHDPTRLPPEALARRSPAPPCRRFNVHRNTVYAGLTGVIETRYPATQWLMGRDVFHAAARMFVVEQPPSSPVLLEYGEGFAALIESLELIDDMPYLADVARLEWLMHEARNAADAFPLDTRAFAAIDPAQIANLTFAFAPSCFLFASPHATFSLWHASVTEEPTRFPAQNNAGEQVLISRRRLEAEAVRLPPAAHIFTSALMTRATLGEAASRANAVDERFPLDQVMALLIRQETLVSFQIEETLTETAE